MSRNGGCRGRDESSREKEELDALDRVCYGYVLIPPRINRPPAFIRKTVFRSLKCTIHSS